MRKRDDDMAQVSISQHVAGNTGQRSVSHSASPATASVRNHSSQVVVGQPGQPGQQSTTSLNNPAPSVNAPSSAMGQATPGTTPISYAAGERPGTTQQSAIQRPDMGLIQSYTDQLRSGTIDAGQFSDQLKAYLSQYRDQARGQIQGVVDDRRNAARQSAAQARQSASQTLSQARQTVNAATAGLPAGSVPAGADAALSDAERWLIERESGGDVNAYNPVTTDSGNAFGVGQLTTANRQRIGSALGIDPDTTDYNQQLAMMRYYIQERYGTPEAAMAFWQQNGWY